MKNLVWLLLFSLALIIAALGCSSPRTLQGVNLTGNWTLQSVQTEGAGLTAADRITLFEDVPHTCFAGSTWSLPANGNGSYTIPTGAAVCSSGLRNIVWSVGQANGSDYLQFKRVDGGRARQVETGFRLYVSNVTDTSMLLRAPLNVGGREAYLVYRFTRP